jgi:hypothetical protein
VAWGHAVGQDNIHDSIVELEECQVQVRHDEVLIIARIANESDLLAVARQIPGVTCINEELQAMT